MKIKSLIYLSLLSMCISLSGCSKKIDSTSNSADFGAVEESSSLVESSEEKK